jgi:hypothetical protein
MADLAMLRERPKICPGPAAPPPGHAAEAVEVNDGQITVTLTP